MKPLEILLESIAHTSYHPEWNLLTWHPRGTLDRELADTVCRVLNWEESLGSVYFDRFIDFSGVHTICLEVDDLYQIAEFRQSSFHRVKSAFYGGTGGGLAIAHMYEALMENAAIEVRAFNYLNQAAKWLGVPVELLESG